MLQVLSRVSGVSSWTEGSPYSSAQVRAGVSENSSDCCGRPPESPRCSHLPLGSSGGPCRLCSAALHCGAFPSPHAMDLGSSSPRHSLCLHSGTWALGQAGLEPPLLSDMIRLIPWYPVLCQEEMGKVSMLLSWAHAKRPCLPFPQRRNRRLTHNEMVHAGLTHGYRLADLVGLGVVLPGAEGRL